ncbi:uncharacterized protein LOC120659589 isoform X7 [Panicum virgatum]|uniref:uncharacterized protein LOC120659589 isoform X7 n=1 Tax=Panicum virgatum TaxID=38727 RepID=UPI0019D5E358|nr:uncharacterized protein LOC120659589 isoform X7 [Panicum virgatum]
MSTVGKYQKFRVGRRRPTPRHGALRRAFHLPLPAPRPSTPGQEGGAAAGLRLPLQLLPGRGPRGHPAVVRLPPRRHRSGGSWRGRRGSRRGVHQPEGAQGFQDSGERVHNPAKWPQVCTLLRFYFMYYDIKVGSGAQAVKRSRVACRTVGTLCGQVEGHHIHDKQAGSRCWRWNAIWF